MTAMYPILRAMTGDRATLDRTAEALCRDFAIAWSAGASWGTWAQLSDVRAGHPAFVIRHTPEGTGLDTQRWGWGGAGHDHAHSRPGLPWWRRLAERPAQRCLIPLTAATLTASARPGRDRRATWFALADEPVFTVAGLWRDRGDARCFAMVESALDHGADALFPTMPMIVAAQDRARWLHGPMEDIDALGGLARWSVCGLGCPGPLYPPSVRRGPDSTSWRVSFSRPSKGVSVRAFGLLDPSPRLR